MLRFYCSIHTANFLGYAVGSITASAQLKGGCSSPLCPPPPPGYAAGIYTARQGMRACNNNDMRNPSLHLYYYGVTHVVIPCLAAYILPSSSVLLHIYCTCFSTFWHCHPYILQHFNGNVFTLFHNM